MQMRHLVLSLFLVSASLPAAGQVKLCSSGFGFQMGLVVVDNPDPIDVGFNIGSHGDVGFSLGKAGELHYFPSVDFWLGGDDNWGNPDRDVFGFEFNLNFFDARYYFPVPLNIQPFVGLGPNISIQYYSVNYDDPFDHLDFDDTDVDVGFNFFAGCDFKISRSTRLFLETRGKLGDWDVFKFLFFGITFML